MCVPPALRSPAGRSRHRQRHPGTCRNGRPVHSGSRGRGRDLVAQAGAVFPHMCERADEAGRHEEPAATPRREAQFGIHDGGGAVYVPRDGLRTAGGDLSFDFKAGGDLAARDLAFVNGRLSGGERIPSWAYGVERCPSSGTNAPAPIRTCQPLHR